MKVSALALTAAGFAAAVLSSPTPAEARVLLGDVADAVDAAAFMVHRTRTVPNPARPDATGGTTRLWHRADPPARRLELPHWTLIEDYARGRTLSLHERTGEVHLRADAGPTEGPDAFANFRGMFARRTAEPEPVTLPDGREALRFDAPLSPPADEVYADVPEEARPEPDDSVANLLVDPGSRLPIRITWNDPTATADQAYVGGVLDEFAYPARLDPELFAVDVPAAVAAELAAALDARSYDEYAALFAAERDKRAGTMRNADAFYADQLAQAFPDGRPAFPPADPLGPAFEDAELTPGVGFGPLRLGMSRDALEAATGVPAFTTGPARGGSRCRAAA